MNKSDSQNSAVGGGGGPTVIELNVGGVFYATTLSTITSEPNSLLARTFSTPGKSMTKDTKGRFFIDRDGVLFRYVLDYLRNKVLTLPDSFHEYRRLKQEAVFYELPGLIKYLGDPGGASNHSPGVWTHSTGVGDAAAAGNEAGVVQGGAVGQSIGGGGVEGKESGYVVVGYRGTFAFGRDGMADVKFRKLARILASGRVSICREVFQDSLNESRDPDRGTSDRYSARFFLKHTFIEQAFDALQEAGFRMVGSAGAGTNSAGETKPGMDSEENKWNHYNEFVFCRP